MDTPLFASALVILAGIEIFSPATSILRILENLLCVIRTTFMWIEESLRVVFRGAVDRWLSCWRRARYQGR